MKNLLSPQVICFLAAAIATDARGIAVTAAQEEPARIDVSELEIPHQKFVLDNGLTLIVHSDHSVPIVAVNVWYHVGSRNEKRGRTGFAHLFEHFFFNGSENHPSGFREAMDDLGANNRNGTTNSDRTNFFEDVPVSAVERTLYLEADRMGFLAGQITEQTLSRERGVVQNEKRQRENQPYGQVFGRFSEAIYPYSHPYSWSTIGSMDDLNAATLQDIQEWYRTYYGPNNCVLSLAGDITAERARELVEKYFGSIPPGPPIPTHEAWVPSLHRDQREVMEDRVPQARIYRFYHAPPWGDPELEHLQLAASVLSGSKSSPLDRRLVYDRQLATQVGAFVNAGEIASSFIVMVTVKPGVDPADAESELDVVLGEMLENGPSSAGLQRAKNRAVAQFTRGAERLGGFGGRSDVLAQSQTYGGDPGAYLRQLEILVESKVVEVRLSTARWLDAPHYTLLVKPFADLSAAKETLDRSVLPDLGPAPDVAFPKIEQTRLENGLQVMLMRRSGVPLVNLTLAVDAGYASDPPERAGTASLALGLMEEGTTTRDGFELADALDSLGASIDTGSSLDLSFVRLRAMKMRFAESLDLLAEVARKPSFAEDMVQLARQRRLAQIAQEKAQPVATAMRVVPPLLYPSGHAYSMPLTGSGDESSVAAIDRGDLAQWHRTWFRPGSTTVIAAGDISIDELARALEKSFGDWQPGPVPVKNIGHVETTQLGKVFLIDKPGASQSVIVTAHLSQPGGQSEDLAMETVMRLFGGMSTSRLNRNLRLDKHWSYGSRAMLVDARGQRPLIVSAPVQTDKTAEAMVEVMAEIRGIAGSRPIEGEEFENIRRNMVLRLAGRFETLSALESAGTDLVAFGYEPEYYYDYARRAQALSAEDLNRAASSFIHPESMFWLVIGDLALIESGIRELDFGELVELGVDGRPIE